MKLRLLLPFFVVLAGCGAPKGPETAPSGTGSPVATTKEGKPAGDAPETKASVPAPDLPAELKNPAYDYYGLATTEPIKAQIEITGRAQVALGTQTTRFKEMKDGKAIYTIERTGEIKDDLGASEEVRLEKDGIYMNSSDVATVGPHDLQLPADLSPGKTWSVHTEATKNDTKLIEDDVLKVVGPSKVTTKLGVFDALLVTSTGKGTIGTQKTSNTAKTWYVKGRGIVRMEMSTTIPGQKSNGKIVFQQVK